MWIDPKISVGLHNGTRRKNELPAKGYTKSYPAKGAPVHETRKEKKARCKKEALEALEQG